MNKKVNPGEVDELIEQFQRLRLRELHVRYGDLELYLSNDPNEVGLSGEMGLARGGRTPAAAARSSDAEVRAPEPQVPRSTTPAPTPPPAVHQWPPDAAIVRAPYLGTFYRAPKPGSPPYVEVGSTVAPESELCIVEVMKLFTGVRAGMAGKVHAILAKDGQMVEANQPLFVLVPAS